jgi:hypothetical protein
MLLFLCRKQHAVHPIEAQCFWGMVIAYQYPAWDFPRFLKIRRQWPEVGGRRLYCFVHRPSAKTAKTPEASPQNGLKPAITG